MHMIGLARLGKDSELRSTNDGTQVLSMALAFNFGRKDQQGQRPSQWVDAALFGDRAEKLAPYLLKGVQIEVHLSDPHIETFKRRDGTEGFKLVAMVGPLEFAANSAPQGQPNQQQQSRQPAAGGHRAPASRPAPNFSDMDDDIPF